VKEKQCVVVHSVQVIVSRPAKPMQRRNKTLTLCTNSLSFPESA
jgi:hypothetical protein